MLSRVGDLPGREREHWRGASAIVMGLFSPPPPPPAPPARSEMMSVVVPGVILACAALCVYNANMGVHAPTARLLAWSRVSSRDVLPRNVFQFVGFAINIVSVAVPGRFDSDVDPVNMTFPWPTLFAPAGFAFAIWGVIYLGELVGMAVLASSRSIAIAAEPASRAWLCANIAQALWCMSFRPWALSRLWLSSACLAATAASLLASQKQLLAMRPALDTTGRDGLLWALLVWPRSLHTGWVTAACLVNVNAWAGKAGVGPANAFATAVLSLIGAIALADVYAAAGLSCAAAAIAWALFAVSKGMPNGKDGLALGQPALDGLATATAFTAACTMCDIVVRNLI